MGIFNILKRKRKEANNKHPGNHVICANCSKSVELYVKFQDCPYCNKPLYGDSTPGFIKGQHFTTYIDTFKQLRREGKLDEAEKMLLKIIEATEAESNYTGRGVAPAYYEYLAIIYRKQKQYEKEVAILMRFKEQKHAPGARPPKLIERLEKAKELAKNKKTGSCSSRP